MKILVALALLLINVAWALNLPAKDSQANGRIFNGTNADETQFPYVVLLDTNTGYCTGTLIGREWVVTAAHCLFGKKSIDVYLGMTYLGIYKVVYSLNSDSIVTHADYNKNSSANDIGLVKIPTVDICDTISPVPLPALNQSHSKYAQQDAFVSGWGWNGNKGSAPERLQWTILPTISNEECKASYDFIDENKICASTTGGTSPCHGDSGGPLVPLYEYKLIGISSQCSTTGCEGGMPIVFTRITSYLQWIKNVTGIWY